MAGALAEGATPSTAYRSFSMAGLLMQEPLHPYFCLICGVNVFTLALPLERHPLRSDGTVAINLAEQFFWMNMGRHLVQYVRREVGVEAHHGWKCPECNVQIGYTAIPFEEYEELIARGHCELSNKPFFYVLQGAVSHDMHSAKLLRELAVYKESVDSHLRRKEAAQAPFMA
jgi:hypothetical protein